MLEVKDGAGEKVVGEAKVVLVVGVVLVVLADGVMAKKKRTVVSMRKTKTVAVTLPMVSLLEGTEEVSLLLEEVQPS